MEYGAQCLLDQNTHQETKLPKVAMLQIEDRVDPFFEWCIQLNTLYCKKHKFDHIILRKGPIDKPAYWWKVSVFLDLMRQDNYDIICWMDSDSFVYNQDVDLRDFFNTTNQIMVVAPDPVGWGSNFMAAVYMVKNNDKGKEIFTDWLNCFNPEKWEKLEDNSWQYTGDGEWAGDDYEQGAFARLMMPKFKKYLKVVPWYVFHETNCKSPNVNCWSIHLPRHIKQTRPSCIIFEQTRKQPNRINPTIIIIVLLSLLLIAIIGLYIWVRLLSY